VINSTERACTANEIKAANGVDCISCGPNASPDTTRTVCVRNV
jgi:hypothetical protein